ncbi:MAG: amidase [candidate division NC10 bacterium]|nr:amidase [candidate division NC10 bacterium]
MSPATKASTCRSYTCLAGLLRPALAAMAIALICLGLYVPTAQSFDLEEATIAQLQEGMQSGKYTARSITEMYLARIQQIDGKGPTLKSILEVNPDALAIADQLDKERREGRLRGPMHGIPVLIKDNIDTADKMNTTAGSFALLGVPVLKDAFLVQKLREAGAIILGKTNMSEWAYFRSTRGCSGWSARGGQCLNPYILTRNPCGSSSGSGAAVAANLAAASVGTETDGSITCPSSANSLVGIKPTLGLISRSGIIPIAHSQDTAGPMARTVADAATLLGAMTGIDPQDPETAKSRGKALTDYTRFLDPNGLRGARIGIARNFFGYHEKIDELINQCIEVMRQQGAIIVDPADIETAGQFGDTEFEVLLYEFKADMAKYLATRPGGPKTLKDLIEFNESHRALEMPYFEQEVFLMADKKGPLTDEAYRKALEKNHRLSRTEGIDATLKKYNLDAIVAPTGGPICLIDPVIGDKLIPPFGSPRWSPSLPAVAGYPHITVPAGYIFGIPVGISFMGGAFSEGKLIKIAYSFEQATKYRKPPQFLPRDEAR